MPGNKAAKRTLIPIDHGLSIPDTLAACSFDLVWLSYSQAEEPFSERSKEYIRNIDIMADINMLEEAFKFRPQCLRNMRISSTLLKKGADAGLTLAQIGQILCRPDDDEEQPSLLEQIVKKARVCANMMAQMQTRIKDSQLRLILPQTEAGNRKSHRRNSAAIMAPCSATLSFSKDVEADIEKRLIKNSEDEPNEVKSLYDLEKPRTEKFDAVNGDQALSSPGPEQREKEYSSVESPPHPISLDGGLQQKLDQQGQEEEAEEFKVDPLDD